MATTKKPTDAKAKHTYQYAPNESVVATCTATTFFSHDMEPAAGAVKPGQPAPVKSRGAYEADDWNSFLGDGGGNCLGAEPDVIENTRNTMKAVQQKKAMDSDAALAASQGSTANPSSANPSSANSGASASAKPATANRASSKPVAHKIQSSAGHKSAQPKQQIAVENKKNPAETKKDASNHLNIAGRRDPFFSPVVNRSMLGSGCSTGKRS